MDELSLYRDLVTADRDVIRVRAGGKDDGAVALSDGVSLVSGARDMLLAAACSLSNPRPLYRAGANRRAMTICGGCAWGRLNRAVSPFLY